MPVFLILLVALVSIPLVELYVLIAIGREIGAGTTIALVILTAFLGAWLLRAQGLATLARVRTSLDAGRLPALEMIEGLILLVTGAMLLTPGFMTDAVGFLCLVPVLRTQLARALVGQFEVHAVRRSAGRGDSSAGGPTIIDGDYVVEDDPARDPPRRIDGRRDG